MICRDAPSTIKAAGIEALLVDQTEPAGGTVAEYLGLPFVTICCALAVNREPNLPPVFTPWQYQKSPWARLRNQAGYFFYARVTQPIQSVLASYRRQWKLPKHKTFDDSFSTLAQISQQPAGFDFPHEALPPSFHYVGPLRGASPRSIPFPYEQLTGQPLIYASLGTLQNTKEEVFFKIAAACAGLDAQLVISHGGGMSSEAVQGLPGSPLVVSYAPQFELLAKASLTITHAGLNTVLDSLSHGVPVVAIPITYEQPAIAARLQWTGAGDIIELKELSSLMLRKTAQRVLSQAIYSQKASQIKTSIRKAGGVQQAASIIESFQPQATST